MDCQRWNMGELSAELINWTGINMSMIYNRFNLDQNRFSLKDKNTFLVFGRWPQGSCFAVQLDRKSIPFQIGSSEYISVLERMESLDVQGETKAALIIPLPDDVQKHHSLNVYAEYNGEKFLWLSYSAKQLAEQRNRLQYYFDRLDFLAEPSVCIVEGWIASASHGRISFEDRNGVPLDSEVRRFRRDDLDHVFKETRLDQESGFSARVTCGNLSEFYLVFNAENGVHRLLISRNENPKKSSFAEKASKSLRLLREYGPLDLGRKIISDRQKKNEDLNDYNVWIRYHLPDRAEIERQKKRASEYDVKFSIVVPLYKTPKKYLMELVRSVQKQTYTNWELCLSDGSGKDSPLRKIIKKLSDRDPRIRAVFHDIPLQISENTNEAIGISTGEYIVFADHDDVLTENALFECAEAIGENSALDIIYSDEDKISMDGSRLFQPHFKPDFNVDLLCTVNYFCHLCVIKKSLIEKAGMLNSEYDGAQDYDLVLRCVENTVPGKIHHIAKILYHWRSHDGSTAENPESKLYAFEAGRKAIQSHYDRLGIPAEVHNGEFLGLYRTEFCWSDKPLISIIIPNKDHIEDLERCVSSIEDKVKYPNYEIIIVENNSECQETFKYYSELEKRDNRIKVIRWSGVFNYSAINNFGVSHANGEYYLFLNNDTEIINPGCIDELYGYCRRPGVGAVGARLYYDDGSIQHAGVIVGFGGIAGHCFAKLPKGNYGYFSRVICAQDYSAVTAACMLVKKEAFDKAGGFTEELAVAFNDVDFCLKLQKAGYLVVYNPYAELYHYESKSRGSEDTPEKVERFKNEILFFENRWRDLLISGDPYYNPNLTVEKTDFSLRRIR